MKRRKNSSCLCETFTLRKCIHPRQASSALTQDKGLANAAAIQCTESFGHTTQLQVGKGMTLLTKAVSQISTNLNTKAELAGSPYFPQALIGSF